MTCVLAGRSIESVSVVDDDPRARRAMALSVTDARLKPIDEPGPLPELMMFVRNTMRKAHAAICDHKLRPMGEYAHFDGAEAVARFYDEGFPAVLCTNYSRADVDTMRRYRRRIPVLMRPDDAEPETIRIGILRCIEEMTGTFLGSRRPWRTLVRVEEVDRESGYPVFYIVLPGWTSSDRIRLPLDLIPVAARAKIHPELRFYAHVNIGAEDQDELFFEDCEID